MEFGAKIPSCILQITSSGIAGQQQVQSFFTRSFYRSNTLQKPSDYDIYNFYDDHDVFFFAR
ncbi:uncharacterized protein LOC143232284 isoform X2 [Tachypleus tridentatus]|uniref:uncharacterized protein LOC143232284 isoform X2 n=1 Tax=Tachypleus tridentatus TaxID=6853 RepID=UPI003FD5EF7E